MTHFKKSWTKSILWLCVVFLWNIGYICTHAHNTLLLLVSFDGFRWDYLDMVKKAGNSTPHFDALIQDGVKAKWIKNTFETKTFPNHFTIVTGMYEDNHGVVANNFYDPVYKEQFEVSSADDSDGKWWDNGTDGAGGGEPIWITNQAGDQTLLKRSSGVYFWPGSEAPIGKQKLHANYYKHYQHTTPYNIRIDTLVSWFSTEDQPINLGLLYFENPDTVGHQHGPESPEIIDTIVQLDGTLGYLIKKLKANGLYDKINIILTSDHGMVSTPKEKIIELEKYIDSQLYTKYGGSPVLNILPKPGE